MQKWFITLLFLPIYLFAQTHITYVADPQGRIREHNVDFTHLQLTVEIEPAQGLVKGNALYTFIPKQQKTDSVFLDGPGILMNSVLLDDVSARFKTDSDGITVYFNPPLTWGSEHTLALNYSAIPRKGIYFIGWNVQPTAPADDPDRIRKQIWTQGQGIDNRHWIPGYDNPNDKLITEMIITFDKNYQVISNGNLISVADNRDNKTKTWHYAMNKPHAFYLIQLAIGEYAIQNYSSKNGIISAQYYYPDRTETLEPTYGVSSDLMDWMETEIGVAYPWETYANIPVQEFLYGAMENTTATIFTDFYMQDARAADDRNYHSVNAHELAHMWFGDLVTEWSGTHHWLHESFATHYSKKFMEYKLGDDFFQWKRREEMISAFSADAKDEFPLAHSEAGGSRHYPKGSIVLDMLRYVVGDAQYRKVVEEYLEKHAYKNVTTNDFYLQFAETLGMNLDWFFDQWVYKAGYPEYTVNYTVNATSTEMQVMQTQKQTQTVGLFKMPVVIQVHYTDGSFDEKMVWIVNEQTNLAISNPHSKTVAFVLFDPNSQLYASVNFKKDFSELRYQAFNAPNMMDRFDAITDMRNIPIDTKRDDLIAIYNKESWHGIKSEIIYQLSEDENKNTTALMKSALNDADVFVRRAAISNVKTINKKLQKDYEKILSDFNYTNIEIALRTLCKADAENTNRYLELTKNEMGVNKNIRTAWIELNGKNASQKFLDELVNYAGPGYEFRTRLNAIASLVAINYFDETLAKNLLNAVVSPNGRLSSPARKALNNFKMQSSNAATIEKVFSETNWSEWERTRIGEIIP